MFSYINYTERCDESCAATCSNFLLEANSVLFNVSLAIYYASVIHKYKNIYL